jgi:lipopolysaccharide/colanic/teichoic acid biosynthesis glycosyltransferase
VINRVVAGCLAILLSPVVALVAIVIRLVDGRPLLFVHERAGLGGTPFGLLKFRTMRPQGVPGELDAARITRVGLLLRRTSLDELPGLWNVVRGEMNLVGPRPLPMAYNNRYSPAEARRLEVKPGLTGLVQVRGRNALTWDEKFALDTWYVEHRSVSLDLRLLLETPLVVLRGRGVSHDGHATMPEFKGQDGYPSP